LNVAAYKWTVDNGKLAKMCKVTHTHTHKTVKYIQFKKKTLK